VRKRLSRLAQMEYEAYKSTLNKPEIPGPKCAICATPQAGKKLAKDHCHRTGIRRGELCMNCNVGIGFFGDSQARLRNAIKYLQHYHGLEDL
jgi:hypothetical protein